MGSRLLARRTGVSLAALAMCLLSARPMFAQGTGGNPGGGGGQGNNQNVQGLAGIVINAGRVSFAEADLAEQQAWASRAKASMDPNLANASKMRMVSITRLEKAVRELASEKKRIPEEMLYLAGIKRLEYVFVFPETNDIVIAGPADGFLGIDSHQPTLELRDLIIALRTFAPGQTDQPVVGCSIDPTQEGLKKMNDFVRQMGGHATPAQTDFIVNGLRTSLGLQTVRVLGVSPKTHFAQVMIEADYRMKLIGIGLEKNPVGIKSFAERANSVGKNALQRWYFTPNYKCVRVSADERAIQLVGEGVQLVGEDEVVGADGARSTKAGKGSKASKDFVRDFTAKYAKLAEKVPVYAQLRNLIDLSVAAAFMQRQDFYGKANWEMSHFGDESACPIEVYETPVEVDNAIAAYWKGSRLMTPIGGGVSITPTEAIQPDNLLADEDSTVSLTRNRVQPTEDGLDRWWWDK